MHTQGTLELFHPTVKPGEDFELYSPDVEGPPVHVCRMIDDGLGEEITKANAERLAACWNACHGIDDPVAFRQQYDRIQWERELWTWAIVHEFSVRSRGSSFMAISHKSAVAFYGNSPLDALRVAKQEMDNL